MATTTMTLVASNAIPLPTAPPEDKYSRKPTRQLPKSMIEVARLTERQKYDYNRHVNFQPPKKSLSMEELGYGGQGITPHAVSDPFPLFSEEGVEQMRREIFSEVVLEKHQYESSFIKNLIRGHCPEYVSHPDRFRVLQPTDDEILETHHLLPMRGRTPKS